MVTFTPPYFVCYNEQIPIEPEVDGGTDTGFTYMWNNGETSQSIDVPETLPTAPGTYTYCVTVTDNLGCMGSSCTDVEVLPPLDYCLSGDSELCWDGIDPTDNNDIPIIIAFEKDIINTTPIAGTEWCIEEISGTGGDLTDYEIDPLQFWVLESESDPGIYEITLKITDIYGCEQETEPWIFTVSEGPEMEITNVTCDNLGTTVEFEGIPDQVTAITICNSDGEEIGGPFFDTGEFTFTEEGDYVFKIVNTTVDVPCPGLFEYTVEPALTPDITVPPVCAGEDGVATVNNPGDFTEIIWLIDGTDDVNGYTITGLTENDTLSIEYVDSNGCAGFLGGIVFAVSAIPEPTISGPEQLCVGSSGTYTAENGNYNDTYLWSPNGEITQSITPVVNADITFTVVVTDSLGCTGMASIDVTTADEIVLNPFDATICEIETILIGVDPTYTGITWSTTETTDSILVDGSQSPYTVSFSNEDDCPGVGTFTINVDNLPVADVTEEVTTCNNALFPSTVNLNDHTGASDGGTWSDVDGAFGASFDPALLDFDGFPANTYKFAYNTNIAGGSPCPEATDTLCIIVENCDCPEIQVGLLGMYCADQADTINIYNVGSPFDDASWSFNGGSSNMTIINDSLLSYDESTVGGTYELMYEFDNIDPACAGLPTNSGTVSFTIFEQPTVTVMPADITICNADTGNGPTCLDFDAFVTSSEPGEWSAPGTFTNAFDPADVSNVCFVGLSPNSSYTFTYEVQPQPVGSTCQPVSGSITVTVLDCDCGDPNVDALPDLCNSGGTLMLNDYSTTADPGDWTLTGANSGGDTNTITFDPGSTEVVVDVNTLPGVYEFTYTLNPAFGGTCDDDDIAFLTVLAAPIAAFLNDSTACSDVPVSGTDLSNIINITELLDPASAAGDYSSSDVDVSDPTDVDFAGLAVGSTATITYTTTTAVPPCTDVTATLTISIVDCDCPFIQLGTLPDVCNVAGTYDLSSTVVDPTGSGDWTLTGATNGGDMGTISNTGATINVTIATVPGTYEFTYTLNPAPPDGCTESATVELNVLQSITAGSVNDTPTYCAYEMATDILSDLLTGEDTGGTWMETSNPLSTGAAFDGTAGTFTMDGQLPGTYTFVYSLDANGPCPGDDEEVTIIIEAEPEANAGLGGEINCTTASVSVGDPVGTSAGDYTYTWYDEDGNVLQSGTNLEYMAGAAGTYTLEVVDNATQCLVTDDVVVTADPNVPSFELTGEGFPCFGDDSGMLVIDGAINGNEPYTVYISGDLDTTFIYSDPSMISDLGAGNYQVYIEDEDGCPSTTQSLAIAQPQPFVITDVPDVDGIPFNTVYEVSINEFINLDSVASVVWTVDGVEVCTSPPSTVEECQSIIVEVDRAKEVCITLTNNDGCEDMDCLWLRTKLENDVYTPNVFSPFGTDDNDWLYPQTSEFGMTVNYFRVFDRWGELIFSNENFPPNVPEEGWDGNYAGQPAVQGVYIYQFEVVFDNGEIRRIAKDVTLIR